jgi:membrane protease subunit HflK
VNPDNREIDSGYLALTDALNVSFRVLRFVLVLLLLLYLGTGVFKVDQHEKAFVLLFGNISGLGTERVKGPGIHWTLPRPFAQVIKVPTERVRTVETGAFWHEARAGVPEGLPPGPAAPAPKPSLEPGKDGYTLTGDANLLHSRWALRYTIENPEAYLFMFHEADTLMRRELEHAIVSVSARFQIDQALRTELEAFRAAVAAKVRERSREFQTGIQVQGVDLLALAPPLQVAAAFASVVEAEQDRSRSISAARGDATRLRNEAQGQAARIKSEAEAYARRLVSEVSADADYFDKVYEQFRENPAVIARTLRQDTVRRTLDRVEQKYLVPEKQTGAQELRLLLSPEAKSPWQKK